MNKGWRSNPAAGAIFGLIRIWLGFEWITHGWDKITGGFDTSGYFSGVLAKTEGANPAVLPWYASFVENFAIPNADLFNILIPWGQLLTGIGLIVGCLTIPALFASILMNLNFLLAGSSGMSPVMYTVAVLLLWGGAATYMFGIDRFLMPLLRERMGKGKKNGQEITPRAN